MSEAADKPLRAYTVIEYNSGENSGDVFFAKSNVEARRMGADAFNDGDFGGLSVHRAPTLDQYAGKPIPLHVMVGMGWWSGCYECGVTINSDLYDYPDEDPVPWPPIGNFGQTCFCCQDCHDSWHAKRAQEPALKHKELQRLKTVAEKYVTHPVFGDQFHCYIDWRSDQPQVGHSSLDFTVPGAEYPMAIKYNEDKHTLHLPLPRHRAAYLPYTTKALDILFDSA